MHSVLVQKCVSGLVWRSDTVSRNRLDLIQSLASTHYTCSEHVSGLLFLQSTLLS